MLNEIELHEQKLFEFMKNKIIDHFNNSITLLVTEYLRSQLFEKEYQVLANEIEPEVLKLMEAKTPYIFKYEAKRFGSSLSPNLASMMCYQAARSFRDYEDMFQGGAELADYLCLVTYKDLDENGFGQQFSKRIIDKFLAEDVLGRIRYCGSYFYYLPKDNQELHFLHERTKEINPIDYSSEFQEFIYNNFSSEHIANTFIEMKNRLYLKIEAFKELHG